MTNARQQVKEKLERFQSLVVPLPIAKQPSLHHFMHSKKMEVKIIPSNVPGNFEAITSSGLCSDPS